MYSKKSFLNRAALWCLFGLLLVGGAAASQARAKNDAAQPAAMAAFSGASALEFTRKAVSFGPRPAGSEANRNLQAYILAQLKTRGCEILEDPFTAQTPAGRKAMKNIIARFPGLSGRRIVFSGHYDTKEIPGIRFAGANDGGSSTGFLLEMARVLQNQRRIDDVYLVWFDGEEAFGAWSDTNGVYGSRHLADRWEREGALSKIKALINVDMIGDRDLGIVYEMNSTPSLRSLVWKVAHEKGYGRHFLDLRGAIEDDHGPFLRKSVTALDLIDFDYGPDNSWWHTAQDSMDKLSAKSFQVVGDVLVGVLGRLEGR